MPSIYEIKQNTAEKLLDIALKHGSFEYYVLGIAGYRVTVPDIDGTPVNGVNFVMNAIYNKHIKMPELQIDKKFYDILSDVIDFTTDGTLILTILSEIEYQMLAAKENRAPFTIDCSKLLEDIKENIARNYSLYQRSIDSNKNGFIGEFKYHDELLRESYNQKIL